MSHRIEGAEFARLSSLYRYGVLENGTDPAVGFAIERLAANLKVPVVQLLFADAHRLVATNSVGPVEAYHVRARGPFEILLNGGPDFVALSAEAGSLPHSPTPLTSLAALRVVSSDDEAIGVLYVADTLHREFGCEARAALTSSAAEIRALLESARRSREDASTGALRREPFLEQAKRLVEISRTGQQWVSLVMLDVASFRATLEAKSPGLGSLVSRLLADLGRVQVRRRDTFGLLDDDRFGILLTDTGEVGARVLANRLSRHLERGWTDAGLTMEGVDLTVASVRPTIGVDTLSLLLDRTAPTKTVPREAMAGDRVA